MQPLLTIALATYKREKHIKRWYQYLSSEMEGVPVGQVEVIISNNASSDGTGEFLNSIDGTYPWLTVNQNEKNIGGSANMELLLHMADGYYVWFPGDDDYPRTGLVKHLLSIMESRKCNFINLNGRSICEKTRTIRKEGKVYPVVQDEPVRLDDEKIMELVVHNLSNLKFQTANIVTREIALQCEQESRVFRNHDAYLYNCTTFRSIRAMQQGSSYFSSAVSILGGDEITWKSKALEVMQADVAFALELEQFGFHGSDCRRLSRRLRASYVLGCMTKRESFALWKKAGFPWLGIGILPDAAYLCARKILRIFSLSNKFETIEVSPGDFGLG